MLVASLLSFSGPGLLSETGDTYFHGQATETTAHDGPGKLPGELVIFRGATQESPGYIQADVAVDEDFVHRWGDDWESRVRQTVERANELLAAVNLSLEVDSIQQWRSDDALPHISAHLQSAEQQVQRTPGSILLAIVGQHAIEYDGWAQERGSHFIVQFYHENPARTQSLIAHEIGHLLGAGHHEDDEECTEDGCIMDQEGYTYATTWCHHHEQVIQGAVASRLAAQGL